MTRLAAAVLTLLLCLIAQGASADTISTSSTMALNNSTTIHSDALGHFVYLLGFTPTFERFDPALGSLTAANLQWTINGSISTTETWCAATALICNLDNTPAARYETSSATAPLHLTFLGSNSWDFSLTGSEPLSLSSVTGAGTYSVGNFGAGEEVEYFTPFLLSIDETASATGTFQVTYTYDPTGAVPEPTGGVPEPSSLMLLSSGLISAAYLRKKLLR